MKKIFLLGLVLMSSIGHAKMGSEGVGGGDLCEDRIKIIRDDLNSWISKGGPKDLQLTDGVSTSDYSKAMLTEIKMAKIKCVAAGDIEYPIQIGNSPKVCRFDKTQDTSQISCDFNKFQSTSESDQYVLIHHEFAGLAGVEIPNGDDSNYSISNQISKYLVDQVVKKLAVKSTSITVSAKTIEHENCNVFLSEGKGPLGKLPISDSVQQILIKKGYHPTVITLDDELNLNENDLYVSTRFFHGNYGIPAVKSFCQAESTLFRSENRGSIDLYQWQEEQDGLRLLPMSMKCHKALNESLKHLPYCKLK